ncbi:MAG: menaquinone biosynthesis decarboxylase [Alistipes sp.]|jgi:4-hydroxy-3-polyprenylbenzoate decarboxylase|nr:menaquinone biosynthesis decarboxylase [Alistipes sp.]
MYKNLATYLARLEREGELVRISAPVSPVLEIAEITDRASKSPGGGRALLFENVVGSNFPVVTNMFGSRRRMAMALGAESLDDITARLDGLLREALSPRGTFAQKVRTLPLLAEASKWFPRRISGRGECQQVVLQGPEAALSKLPVLKCWPCDGGRFVTLPLVHTVDPETNVSNVGMYRMQIFDDRTTGMHWHIHKTGARHYDAYKRSGVRKMPVTVCLGGDPAYTYAATAPMPDGMDEYLLAGFLRRRPVKLVKCLTNDLWVPSDCDFVIEGYVDTSEPPRVEGPFGDHTGFYSLEDLYPAFHVTAITHRRDAVYPATLVGVPPQEDAYIAEATERIFLPPIRHALQPEVRDLHMPPAGVAHNLAIVSMDVAYPGQAEKVASALWGAGQMMFNKVLVVVPAGVDVRDTETVLALLRGVDVGRDLVFGRGVADVLDHATGGSGVGSKLLIDLTGKRIPVNAPSSTSNFRLLLDSAAESLTPYEKLWLALANVDPARDIRIEEGVAFVDARAKTSKAAGMPPRWPNVATMDADTIALVDRRWPEYGLDDLLESPSARYRKLLLSDGAEVGTTKQSSDGAQV